MTFLRPQVPEAALLPAAEASGSVPRMLDCWWKLSSPDNYLQTESDALGSYPPRLSAPAAGNLDSGELQVLTGPNDGDLLDPKQAVNSNEVNCVSGPRNPYPCWKFLSLRKKEGGAVVRKT